MQAPIRFPWGPATVIARPISTVRESSPLAEATGSTPSRESLAACASRLLFRNESDCGRQDGSKGVSPRAPTERDWKLAERAPARSPFLFANERPGAGVYAE